MEYKINLSDRLDIIGGFVSKGSKLADIGTDHGYLPLSLWEHGIIEKGVFVDISKESLQKAIDNKEIFCPNGDFEFYHGDGLKALNEGQVDTVVIAGMGGTLMTQIMEGKPAVTASIDKFILQPRNRSGVLRKWLIENGFSITGERLVREGRYICQVIMAENNKVIHKDQNRFSLGGKTYEESASFWQVPQLLVEEDKTLYVEFLQNKIEKEKTILKAMEKSKDLEDAKKETVRNNIVFLEGLLNEV